MLGDEKHKDNHWTEGVSVADILDGVKRHVAAIELGNYDDEEGSTHAAAAAVGLMYISHYRRADPRYNEFFDQRYGPTEHTDKEVAGQGVPEPDLAGCAGEISGGSGGAIQKSEGPRGDCRRVNTRPGSSRDCGCEARTCNYE